MYRLNPVDAYEQGLVKKIEVLSLRSEDDFNKPYIRLISVSNKNGYKAKVEIDEKTKNGTVKRTEKEMNASSKNDLYLLSGERDLYKGYVLAGIDCTEGSESIEFENDFTLSIGEVSGDIDDDLMKRYQIREAIRIHLDKELRLVHLGIKVLTLFFIDLVENYRQYPKDSSWQKGKYALMFEEEYTALMKNQKYRTLFEEDAYIANQKVEEVHNGYFSRDKQGNFKNSKTAKDGSLRSNKDDESAFELIMQEKEKLLSFSTPLRFIFSHSALKEGWDNPNVFQICTLVETQDTLTKRQKIGRGLRLAVNQNGERQYDGNINVLTVIANESYEDFAESLQTEMENETGVKFGYIEEHVFATITELDATANELKEIGYEASKEIFSFLVKENYVSSKGRVEQKLKEALVIGTFELPEPYIIIKEDVERVIKTSIKKLPVFNKKDQVEIKLNKEVLVGKDFKELWDKIKYKTTYSVDFDVDILVRNCIRGLQELKPFKSRRITRETASLDIKNAGVSAESRQKYVYDAEEEQRRLPDILRYLQDYTNLKRKTLAKILTESKRLDDFKKNPQQFMEQVAKVINIEKRKLILDGVKYQKIGDQEYYEQSLFENQELVGYMKANALQVDDTKSVYDYIRYDSEIERVFAEKLNRDDDVKLFVKLPDSFTIDTPLGKYNPDWAILYDNLGEETLYFVVETKGSIDQEDLRFSEDAKITCGRKHFAALDTEVKYDVVNSYDCFKELV